MGQGEIVIVTGAAGFIGSHVCEALLARGSRVVGIDNFDPYYDEPIKRANIAAVERAARGSAGGFELVEADIRDAPRMRALMPGAATLIHLAARAGVRPSIEQPELYADVNVHGTTILLEAARRAGVERVVMASSSSVYGDAEKVPFAETDPVNEPISPYAATKRACELIAHTYHHLYALPVACLRFFTVFGPRQRPDLAIARFMRHARAGKPITMFGDGSTSRDYTYIDDIVQGVLASCARIDEAGYRIWNLGHSEPVTLRAMIDAIGEVTGSPLSVDEQPMQAGDVTRTYADLTRSSAELGYSPTTSFMDGLAMQWAWMQKQDAAAGA